MKATEVGPSSTDGKGQHIKQMVTGHQNPYNRSCSPKISDMS